MKEEIYCNKSLYSDLFTSDGDKFEIKYSFLPQRLPYFETRGDIYTALLGMRQRLYRDLQYAHIVFTIGCDPTISIELQFMIEYMNTRGITRDIPSTTSSTGRVSKGGGSSGAKKVSYKKQTVKNLYNTLKLKQQVDNIKQSLINVTNPSARDGLLSLLYYNIQKQTNTLTTSSTANINDLIVSNIVSFLKKLQGKSMGSIPTNFATTKLAVVCAALYGHADDTLPGLSAVTLSEHLDINRSYVTKAMNILTASEESETMSETMSETLNPDTDLSAPTDPVYDDEYDFELGYELEHEIESVSSDEELDEDDEDDESYIPSDSDGDEASEEYMHYTTDIKDIVQIIYSGRKVRSDKQNLDVVREW